MLEVLRSSSVAFIPTHGFHASRQRLNSCRSRSDGVCGSCNVNISYMEQKVIRKLDIIYELNKSSFFREGGNWIRTHQGMPGMRWRLGPVRSTDSVMLSGFDSALVCEEAEIDPSVQGGEKELDMSTYEHNVTTRADHNERTNNTMLSDFDGRVCLSEAKMHFLEERDEEMLSRSILRLSRSNKVRSALELYISMEGLGLLPSAHACNSLMACVLRNGSLDDALRIFMMMTEKDIATGHTFSLILKAAAVARGYHSSLELSTELEEEGKLKCFDAIAYNTMISVCAKAKDWVQMEKMWRRLKEDGHNGTTVTYSLLVCNFLHLGQTELAIDAYIEMIHNQLKPSEAVMKAVVGACAKEGKWDLSLSVFQRMLDSGLKPNAVSYNEVINCLGKAGKVNLAFRIYNLMKSSGLSPDAYTWNALLGALYRGSHYADALQLFDHIKRESGSELNVHLYNVALMSCQKLAFWDRSLQLLWQMEASGLTVSTVSYNHAISACEAARKPKVALQVYKHMIHKKCIPDTFTYLSLIRACVWGSLWVEAEEILDRATLDVSLSSLYNALLQGMCLQGQSVRAKKLYMHMHNSGIKPDGKTRALMLQQLTRDLVRRHVR
eukprot:TRINITY_DN4415_c0_g1_i7.p1 TRINITY_DN4415_c0_g1~~TRINITY_DN4415_c0_g1_i7.p1  ORF type:complete len:609 (+),score=104.76 TRINITY_DN4415_c0_g1_i7:641-2467(+)